MITALVIGTVLFTVSLALHLAFLRWARMITPKDEALRTGRFLGGSLVVLTSHLLVGVVFAIGLYVAASLGLGNFAKEAVMGWMDYYYYALMTVTTLGLGGILPTEHLRVITGIGSLTGFLLISCTAQYVYQTMVKQED